MSYLSKFVFNPIRAALARAASSSNPGVASAAKELQASGVKIAHDVNDTLAQGLSANSAVALKNAVVKDLEDGIRNAVDAYVVNAIPLGLGVAAVPIINAGLDYAEQHLHNYIAALFDHAKETHAAQAEAPLLAKAQG
jgi:hypothetical protein